MTPEEAVTLCGMTAAACPSQKFNDYTPDVWGEILIDIRFVDAKEAMYAIKRRQPWVDPSEIIAEVKRIRRKRIDEYGPIPPPPDLDPDDWRAFQKWQADATRAIGDGTFEPAGELEGLRERPVRQITQNAFKEPR